MSEEILQPNTPVKFAARNMRPKFRRLKSGDIFLVEYEVEEEVWNSLRTVPENALLENVLWHHDGDPAQVEVSTPAKPKKAPSGPFSAYWSRMFAKGFNNYPALIETLDCAGDQIRLRLHDIFQVDTCSDISPTEFEAWMESEGEEKFASLITLSRQAQARVLLNQDSSEQRPNA